MRVLEKPLLIKTVGKTPLWVIRSILLKCVKFTTSAGPLVCRNLETLVNEEDKSISLILDRHLKEKMGYSVSAVLEGAREKKPIWDEREDLLQNTPVCNSLQGCENKLYEDVVDSSEDKEDYLLTPEVMKMTNKRRLFRVLWSTK